jgi:hypothetical protein
MKILFAGDEHPYSAYALQEVVRLALNTWADVTLLGVSPGAPGREAEGPGSQADQPLARALRQYLPLCPGGLAL